MSLTTFGQARFYGTAPFPAWADGLAPEAGKGKIAGPGLSSALPFHEPAAAIGRIIFPFGADSRIISPFGADGRIISPFGACGQTRGPSVPCRQEGAFFA
jgi:hypothetical protein